MSAQMVTKSSTLVGVDGAISYELVCMSTVEHSFQATSLSLVEGRPSRTIGAIQIGNVKDIGCAALRVAIGAATDSGLALLKSGKSKGQSNKSGESDGKLHGDGRRMMFEICIDLEKIEMIEYSEWRADCD